MQKRTARRQGSDRYAPGIVEVVFARQAVVQNRSGVESTLHTVHADLGQTLDFKEIGRVVQVLHVAPGEEDATVSALRSNPLVQSVSRGTVRYAMSTTASSAFPNDPFFVGLSPVGPPFYQTNATGGQWDMHVICAANAWAYGKTNSTGITHAAALGGTAPIAIIDTGADMTHPELASRISYSESDLSGTTTVGTVTDNDGHGTNVAGIAGAAANNALGFAGVAYAAPLMIFKVFPDPPCGADGCNANTADVGTAINHAVQQGAKVISMSLGGSTGDPLEENAVANAIAAGVVVVAASGNDGTTTLDYPARDPGVIAVGASGLDDSTSTITENVAYYSNYDAAHSTTWGVVAPGGNAPNNNDNDPLHWIENLYTSTASDSNTLPNAPCRPDPGSSGPNDCRILIEGTSQATPHVAGAAALLLSVSPSLTPAAVKSALCSTATPIVGGKAGCGRLNVYKAMAQVVGDPNP